jgi:hypothetical protein
MKTLIKTTILAVLTTMSFNAFAYTEYLKFGECGETSKQIIYNAFDVKDIMAVSNNNDYSNAKHKTFINNASNQLFEECLANSTIDCKWIETAEDTNYNVIEIHN